MTPEERYSLPDAELVRVLRQQGYHHLSNENIQLLEELFRRYLAAKKVGTA